MMLAQKIGTEGIGFVAQIQFFGEWGVLGTEPKDLSVPGTHISAKLHLSPNTEYFLPITFHLCGQKIYLLQD
jgi:hypothetical protein